MKDVFISYSRRDLDIARQIKAEIEKRTSVECWMDMEGIESGSQFQDIIISAINGSRIVILLLSENSMKSPWVKKEINYAHEKQKKVIPVNIDGSQPGDWFLFTFSGNDVIDFNNIDQQRKFFKDISGWCSRKPGQYDTNESDIEKKDRKYDNYNIITDKIELSTFTKYGIVLQYFLWAIVGLCSLWITVTGGLRIGHSILPLFLDILIAGTLASTYFLSKGKKASYVIIGILDFLEIYVLCKMGTEVYKISENGGFTTYVYQNLWGIGAYIKWKSFLCTYAILSLTALIHIAILTYSFILENRKMKRSWF